MNTAQNLRNIADSANSVENNTEFKAILKKLETAANIGNYSIIHYGVFKHRLTESLLKQGGFDVKEDFSEDREGCTPIYIISFQSQAHS